jgi:hypothetical protein
MDKRKKKTIVDNLSTSLVRNRFYGSSSLFNLHTEREKRDRERERGRETERKVTNHTFLVIYKLREIRNRDY